MDDLHNSGRIRNAIEDLRVRFPAKERVADAVAHLKAFGCSIPESITAIRITYKLPESESTSQVLSHPVWTSERAKALNLQRSLADALGLLGRDEQAEGGGQAS